jgi:AAA15 family ATPase/GTPase
MLLQKLQIENFKSVEDSTMFSVGGVTCLVGKNESGKTTLLQALYKLNPAEEDAADFDALVEYPRRHWSEYKERMKEKPDNVVTTVWQLTAKEIEEFNEAVGAEAIKSDSVTVKKGYNNETVVDFGFDHPAVIAASLAASTLHDEEKQKLKGATVIGDYIKALKDNSSRSEREEALLTKLNQQFPNGTGKAFADSFIEKRLPKIIYFSTYYTLPGQVALTQLVLRQNQKNLQESDRVFLALLDMAGTTPKDISGAGKFEELVAELEAVSNRLSRDIFKYWTQNQHLKINFRFDAARPQDPAPFNEGYVFRTRIWNERHGVSVGFDERSSGFIWFFSFLVWFSQVRKIYGENLLILLDEPALNLHARAQADLLRYINEKLKPSYQVIYTTHSPWMIDNNNLLGTRTVEDVSTKDGEVLGTKVSEDVLSVDPDTLFPLQGALGYDIAQSLFIGEHNLLVEGSSDLLYLKWFSRELEKRKREGLDRRWVISPVGGVDKVASFVALFGGKNLHIAVFTDLSKGQKAKIKSLKESSLLKQGHVFTADMFTKEDEADIEDMIGRGNYVALINKCYDLAQPLPAKKPAKASVRVLQEVEAYFATLPPAAPNFDHFTPSVCLVEHGEEVAKLMPDLDTALDRFESLFKALNALLPKA